jgi:hypothetical protein
VVDVAIVPAVLEIVGTLATNGTHIQRCGDNAKKLGLPVMESGKE